MIVSERAKVGDVVEVPDIGKVKISRPIEYKIEGDRIYWTVPGYRWIESKQKFSGTARLWCFNNLR